MDLFFQGWGGVGRTAIAWVSGRFKPVSRLVKAEPQRLVYQGALLPEALRHERVVEAEVLAAIREQGLESLDGAAAVVLETDGSFSVIPNHNSRAVDTLSPVAGSAKQRHER